MSGAPRVIVALLALAAVSDAIGGVWTALFNGVMTMAVCAALLALPMLVWAFAVSLFAGGRRGR